MVDVENEYQRDCSKSLLDVGTFDLIFSNAFVQWLPNQEEFIENAFSMLNEKGIFAAQIPLFEEMPANQCIIKANEKMGIQFEWERGFVISVDSDSDEIVIKANSEGLISLAKQFLTLAQRNVPYGSHIHLDEYNSLESGSIDLIVEKRDIHG